jgi:predicted nucleic acid-binding protein
VILVDTSVWIHHLARAHPELVQELYEGRVYAHPFVIGELALGSLKRRVEVEELLAHLPRAPVASDDEVLSFVRTHTLHGRGIGWIDAHLLASARLSGSELWTTDRRLLAAALHVRVRTRS